MQRRVASLSPKATSRSRRTPRHEGDTGAGVPAVLAALKKAETSAGSSIALLWLPSLTIQIAWLTRSAIRRRDWAIAGAANARAAIRAGVGRIPDSLEPRGVWVGA